MDSVLRPNSAPSRLDRALTVLLLAGAVIYALYLYRHGSPYAGGADSSGYLNSARLLTEGRFLDDVRVPDGHSHTEFSLGAFQPLGFSVQRKLARMAPTYPLGLPLHLAAVAPLAGWDRASLIVNLVAALGSGGLLWLLARHFGFSSAWAAIAVGWLWLCPQQTFCALEPMSDSLAVLWSLLTLYAALRSHENLGWSVICGIALAMAVLVRPTNALLFFPVLVAIGFKPTRLIGLILGGLPGAVFLGYYNYHVYGAVLTTGYGDVASSFSTGFLRQSAANIGRWLPVLLSPLILLALVLPFLPGRWSRAANALALWVVLLIGFYAFYFHTSEMWWYLRFILPAFPLLILGAVAVLRRIPSPSPASQGLLLGAVMAFTFVWEARASHQLNPAGIAADEQTYRSSSDWVRKNLPANSAIFCMQVSGAFHFYTDLLLVRWDQIEPACIAPLLDVLREQHRPVYAVLYEFETKDALARVQGQWKKVTTVGVATVWQREDQ
jgi:hypothetical protein